MTEAEKHASQRMREIVGKYVVGWGHGWPRLGSNMREAFIRAEALAEISRISTVDSDPITYQALVDANLG